MRRSACLIILALAGFVRADILHLQDGSRHYGTLISQTENGVTFRITLDDGRSTFVKTFSAAAVKRVERTALSTPPLAPRAASQPAETAADAGESEALESLLREAFQKIDGGDLAAAVRLLQQTVNRAKVAELLRLDQKTQEARGLGLAELLADTRLRHALARGKGKFKLSVVTPFEAAAMSRLLVERHKILADKRYGERTLTEWATERAAYETLRPDARLMVADTRLAAALLNARLRFDPQLKNNREERQRLTRFYDDLVRFAAQVAAMPGFTDLSDIPDDDGEAEPLWRRAMEQSKPPTGETAPEIAPERAAPPLWPPAPDSPGDSPSTPPSKEDPP